MRRRFEFAAASLAWCVSMATAWGQLYAPPAAGLGWPCQILDDPYRPVYEAGLSIKSESDFGDYGKTGFIELDARWDFAAFQNVLASDVDMALDFNMLLPLRSAEVDMPYQLVRLAADAGMTWRYIDGMGLQVRAAPGIYSDLEVFSGGGINCPISGLWIQSFSPALSGMAGLRWRPGFDNAVLPVAVLAWEPVAPVHVLVGFPKTEASWFVTARWRGFAGFDWSSDTYALRDDGDTGREEITIKGWSAHLGAAFRCTDELQLVGAIGNEFDRSVEFDEPIQADAGKSVDVDSGMFVRFGVAGPF